MEPKRYGEAIRAVEEYCRGIIALKGRPSDDNIETAEKVLKIIHEELEKK
jgi:hypothetical protein